MLHALSCDPSQKRFTVTVVPPASLESALSCLRDIRNHKNYRNDYGILIDLSSLDQPLSVAAASSLGRVVKAFFPGQTIALALTNARVQMPWAALQYISSPEVEVKIFSKLGDAEAWLAESRHRANNAESLAR